MAIKLFEKLSNNYIDLFENGEDFNVIIKVGNIPNIKEFKVHSAILKSRSLYFCNELAKAVKDTNNITRINLVPQVSFRNLKLLLSTVYLWWPCVVRKS
ncbi:hypothetical protein C2G38_384416 [Gigaspora rosea]|uniref:BTB domain-containing protein n=1 Tax=Gigaspora rosea TaxID=44941 RepID=A0A397UCV8_9GLOM|nr:hypothetical protein C2G38_384416 [Gigaspora rosea]